MSRKTSFGLSTDNLQQTPSGQSKSEKFKWTLMSIRCQKQTFRVPILYYCL